MNKKKVPIIEFQKYKAKQFWIRIFGKGILVNWDKDRPILFSERNKIGCICIGRIKFSLLK